MKRVGKPVFFIVLVLIAALTYTAFFGIYTYNGDIQNTIVKGANDIRWGIDIRGGVDVTFSPPEGYDATDDEMAAAESVIKVRLVTQNITDSEVYTDYNKDRIIVRFPWKADETNFDPQSAIAELGETAMLTFREGKEVDESGKPTGVTAENIILTGSDVKKAEPRVLQDKNQYVVSLELEESGKQKFADATTRLAGKGVISIWMDDVLISYPNVDDPITDGNAMISGGFTAASAKDLADKINSGALPFKLETENYNAINPTLGLGAKDAMVLAGGIAFALVAIFIIAIYRLPGVVAMIALTGQMACTIAAITGFFPFIPSFTLTLPGIAGIILSIGVGVDANVITSERIKEEINTGKSLDGCIDLGYSRAFTAIFDSNITVVFVAVILMGAFGPPSSLFATILSPLFRFFGQSTAGAVYSFGYTLLVGIILNFVFGVTASRLMLKSLSKFKPLRKAWLYGGKK
ncbi:preprotein translocase subunit SecD [Zongyangia hominis]|uniref:Protein translocase subunit SecD n=1 Tax=Zongyangia hominis TaxID=2763677 RepID=A0A926IAS1_9FIRM|nr:SecD/SecF family protein translocase subunit [Zongyangia hominis]MBC8569508.1 SecD/SecF family protein translocase subunit [Zongyangia hominis]